MSLPLDHRRSIHVLTIANLLYDSHMENSENIHEIPAKKPRKPYTRKPIAAIPEKLMTPPPPQVPNPNILAMESKIGELVEARSQAKFNISRAEQVFQQAQMGLRREQEQFSSIEHEIQYRMGLIQQMRGGPSPAMHPALGQGLQWEPAPPQPVSWMQPSQPMSPPYNPTTPYPSYPPAFDPRQVPSQGVGSAPGFPVDPITGRYSPYPDVAGGPDGARTSSAEEVRRDELQRRGY